MGSVKGGISSTVRGVAAEGVVTAFGNVVTSVKGEVSYAAGSTRDGIAGVFGNFRQKAGGYFYRNSSRRNQDGSEEVEYDEGTLLKVTLLNVQIYYMTLFTTQPHTM